MCIDHPMVRELIGRVNDRVVTYGFSPQADFRLIDLTYENAVTKFRCGSPTGSPDDAGYPGLELPNAG